MGRGGTRIRNSIQAKPLATGTGCLLGRSPGKGEWEQEPDSSSSPWDSPSPDLHGEEGLRWMAWAGGDRALPFSRRPRLPPPLHSWGRGGPGGPGGGGGVDVKQMAGQAGPPPRRRGSQRGGVCAPRDSSSETPRGPSQLLVCGDRPAPGRGLPRPCGQGRPDRTRGSRWPPLRARTPPQAASLPSRGDALDLALASDRPTRSSDSSHHS